MLQTTTTEPDFDLPSTRKGEALHTPSYMLQEACEKHYNPPKHNNLCQNFPLVAQFPSTSATTSAPEQAKFAGDAPTTPITPLVCCLNDTRRERPRTSPSDGRYSPPHTNLERFVLRRSGSTAASTASASGPLYDDRTLHPHQQQPLSLMMEAWFGREMLM